MNKNLWKLLLQKYRSSTLIAMKMLYEKFHPNLVSKIIYLMSHYKMFHYDKPHNDSIEFNICLLIVIESGIHCNIIRFIRNCKKFLSSHITWVIHYQNCVTKLLGIRSQKFSFIHQTFFFLRTIVSITKKNKTKVIYKWFLIWFIFS